MSVCLQCIWNRKMPILEEYKCVYIYIYLDENHFERFHFTQFWGKKMTEMNEMIVWLITFGMTMDEMSVYLQCICNEN